MRPAGFLFRTSLLAVFTLSLLAGVIVSDYFLRHEVSRQAKRFLDREGVKVSISSALESVRNGKTELLEKLEQAGVDLGMVGDSGETPLLLAVEEGKGEVIDFLIDRPAVIESINEPTVTDRKTPLAVALNQRDFELAEQLIDAGASADVEVEAGLPFLIHAVREGDDEMMEFLLAHGADVEYRGAEPIGALAVAVEQFDYDAMNRLFEAGANPDVRGHSGKPLLIQTVINQQAKLFDLMIDRGADVNVSAGESTEREKTALSYAVANGNKRMQGVLLEKGASPNVFGVTDEPLLFETVQRGDGETAKRLLDHEANPDTVASTGGTPLKAAVLGEALDLVGLLLDYDSNPSFAPKQTTPPLMDAVEQGNIAAANQLILANAEMDGPGLLAASYERRDDPLMNLLLNAGVDPESAVPGTDTRVFDVAVRDGAVGPVRTLLGAGAEIGDNLWAALLTGQDELIRLILNAGGDPRQKGPNGQDPLNYCLTHHRYKAARELLDGGADPNTMFDSRESWVAKSIKEGNAPMALALVQGGAHVKGVKTRDGHTLLAWAVANEMPEVVRALLKAGADPDVDERYPSSLAIREKFSSTSFRTRLRTDRRIRPIMMAAAHRNHEIAQILMDGGANGRAYTPKYLSAAIIGSWYGDAKMQQIALLGKVPKVQPRKVVVDLSSQRVTLYENGVATYSTRCSTGKRGYRTPTGEYVISDRNRHHTSSIYGSSMPFFQRFSYSAFGLHQGYVPGYPASHGCIRLPYESARYLFGKLQVGDYAVIQQ